jgi:lipid A 3-O-deacylase
MYTPYTGAQQAHCFPAAGPGFTFVVRDPGDGSRPQPFRPMVRLAPRFIPALLLMLAATRAAGQPVSVRLRSDNDAYRFWVPMATRPDQEYSNGLQLELERFGAPVWGRLAGIRGCDAHRCATTTLSVGQKIFTPRLDAPDPIPGQRPYAGWLYAAATAAVGSPRMQRTAGLEVGVTGSPSAGRLVQTTVHRALGMWEPKGWDGQIPFEPGAVLRYDQRHMLVGGGAVQLIPSWGASLGTVRTEARAGVRGRLGYRLDAPWVAPGVRARAPVSVYAVGELRGRAVAHDLFLDGATFRGGPSVDREPWVGEWEAGVGIRVRGFGVEYRVTSRSREYRTEPSGHEYATFDLSLQR